MPLAPSGRLKEDRFYDSDFLALGIDGNVYSCRRVSYESANALYDIDLQDDVCVFKKNTKSAVFGPFHRAIVRRFLTSQQ